MTKDTGPDEEDIALFRHSVGEVIPVTQNTAELEKPKSRRPTVHLQENGEDHSKGRLHGQFIPDKFCVSATDLIEYRKPGLQDRMFRRLKRGQIPVNGELDLHGMTADKAQRALDKFMAQTANYKTQTCIRIVHGKGYGSKDRRPVIKQYIQMWLQDHKKVLGYSSCLPADGGTGAVYVLIKAGER